MFILRIIIFKKEKIRLNKNKNHIFKDLCKINLQKVNHYGDLIIFRDKTKVIFKKLLLKN